MPSFLKGVHTTSIGPADSLCVLHDSESRLARRWMGLCVGRCCRIVPLIMHRAMEKQITFSAAVTEEEKKGTGRQTGNLLSAKYRVQGVKAVGRICLEVCDIADLD